jgi:hypothetical protein
MKQIKQKLNMYRPATYQIKVPEHLDESWADWAGRVMVTEGSDGEGFPVTTLT